MFDYKIFKLVKVYEESPKKSRREMFVNLYGDLTLTAKDLIKRAQSMSKKDVYTSVNIMGKAIFFEYALDEFSIITEEWIEKD